MAKNYSAYEAAKVLMGNNVEEISEVGSRYPLFTRTVSMANSEYLLDILKALPKVTARVVETGLKDLDSDTDIEDTEQEETKETKTNKKAEKKESKVKPKSKQFVEGDDEDEEESEDDDYENMTSKELYKLCCDRGISSKCKDRKKSTLIELLKANDAGEDEEESDDWGEEEEETKDQYEGKTAKELYKMCCDRGIKAKTKQTAEAYVKLLKQADAQGAESEEEDDDDDWEI